MTGCPASFACRLAVTRRHSPVAGAGQARSRIILKTKE